MAKIATLAAGLALIMSQPLVAAPLPTVAPVADNGGTPVPDAVGPDGKVHRRRHRDADTIVISLAAFTALFLGILAAATDAHNHPRRPASP